MISCDLIKQKRVQLSSNETGQLNAECVIEFRSTLCLRLMCSYTPWVVYGVLLRRSQ